jgi:GntR family transcriptional regulator of vanillate catabolism
MTTSNHASKIVYQLSQLIVQGDVVAGEKLTEIPLAERFGVSRTPVRQALAVLEQEGLLVRDAGRSYVVRHFTLEEILDAIEVRSVLEGLAARDVAQRRLPWSVARELETVLAEEEEVVLEIERLGLTAQLTEQYFNCNGRFHRAITAGANNRAIVTALEVTGKIPFGSVGSIARYGDSADDDEVRTREKLRLILHSHLQHQDVFEAIRAGHPARAEALMREHAHLAIRNLRLRDDYPPS